MTAQNADVRLDTKKNKMVFYQDGWEKPYYMKCANGIVAFVGKKLTGQSFKASFNALLSQIRVRVTTKQTLPVKPLNDA